MRALTTSSTFLFAALLLCTAPSSFTQVLLTSSGTSGTVRVFNSDLAVIEAGESRKDLPCVVIENKPVLGFDLRFHSGYEVSVPLRELAGTENMLTVLFRVTPLELQMGPQWFTQRIRVPAIEEDAKGDAYLYGAFDLGVGKYKVDWLIRDRTERVCSSSWELESALPPKDKLVAVTLAAGSIHQVDREQFRDEPPVVRSLQESPLNVKVLVNFAPQNSRSSTLQPFDTSALISILRNISREPRIGRFTVVAFNLHEQRVIYREDNADKINFPAIGEALAQLNLGTVDLKRLSNRNGDTEFLTNLIRQEVGTSSSPPDAVVFAGPKALLEEGVPQDSLRQIGEIDYPVFYMNYNLYPQAVPWNDTISKAVKFFKGYEYTISKPRDLWFAVTEMVSKIVKTKQGRRSGTSSSE
ncbi:MAG: acetyltransferase [Bryobacteraceae bacterium]